MHFEKSLRRTIYPPWKDQYIDYAKLKTLLKDEGSEAGSSVAGRDQDDDWTEEDEGAFVEELVNVQLEKVHSFQSETIQKLRERTTNCESKLDPVVNTDTGGKDVDEDVKKTLREVLTELDGITKEMNELEKFSRINYTGFLKATKKHDRRRGDSYRVRPLMQVRLAALPFNKEDYSPLLFRLSTMYNFIRQNLDGKSKRVSLPESHAETEKFSSYKFWVHPENMLELKTVLLRRLPVLVYNPSTSKVAEGIQKDPTITSIYFDNPNFSLYNDKVAQGPNSPSLRLRWYDQVNEAQEIYCEKKTILEGDESEEQRLNIRPKHVKAFLDGSYKMEKEVAKLTDRFSVDSEQVRGYQKKVSDIQSFLKENDLQPIVRANYTRTAFQIPGDSRVRITLDTDLAFIREDALDQERPCRDPEDWHRTDIDDASMEYPFNKIRKGEVNRFPFALLEIRIQGEKKYEWVNELMNSHLVKQAPRFSKFVHGVAVLFEDYVNTFPFWLSEVETDIRKDPHQAFEEEQEKKAKEQEDETAVGSFLKSRGSKDFAPLVSSPVGSPQSKPSSQKRSSKQTDPSLQRRATTDMTRVVASKEDKTGREATVQEVDSDEDAAVNTTAPEGQQGYLRSLLPASMSKYAQAKRGLQGRVELPPGVTEPSFWIKDEGPVKVEAKVWLANQRTFIKWQHIAILLASLSLGLYNAAGAQNTVAKSLGVVYTCLAVFAGLWGYGIYIYRNNLIAKRSGKDFDNIVGPIIVCVGLTVALWVNFAFKWHAFQVSKGRDGPGRGNGTEALNNLWRGMSGQAVIDGAGL